MRIEISKFELLHVDSARRAHVRYGLQFWDSRNNPIANQEVKGFEKNSENGSTKVCDNNTNLDGEISIQVAFDIINETHKAVEFTIGLEKREIILTLDMARAEVRQMVDQVLNAESPYRKEQSDQANKARLQVCKERGQFQEQLGIGRISIGSAWVIINKDGEILSQKFHEIREFDLKTKRAKAQIKKGQWFVLVNELGQIIDEATDLPVVFSDAKINTDGASIPVPIYEKKHLQTVLIPSWKADLLDYYIECKSAEQKIQSESSSDETKKGNELEERGLDLFKTQFRQITKKYEDRQKDRDESIKDRRKSFDYFCAKNQLPAESSITGTVQQIRGLYELELAPGMRVMTRNVELRSNSFGKGYLSDCPIVYDLTAADEINLYHHLVHKFRARAKQSLPADRKVDFSRYDGRKDLLLEVGEKPVCIVDLEQVIAFLKSHRRFSANIYLDGKLYARIFQSHSAQKPGTAKTFLTTQQITDIAYIDPSVSHSIQIDLCDDCGVGKFLIKSTVKNTCLIAFVDHTSDQELAGILSKALSKRA